MALLKSYTCSKCAGVLFFDSDQEFFECPFCGTGFDAVDFHGDELLDQGEECLKQSDFAGAKEKFIKILEKDPSNFAALKGRILSEARCTSTEGLKDPEFYKKCRLSPVRAAVNTAVDRSPEFAVDYFAKLSQMVSIAEELAQVEDEQSVVKRSLDETSVGISRRFLSNSRQSFKHSLIIMGAAVAFASVYHFVQMLAAGITDWTFFLVIEGLMVLVYGAFFLAFFFITRAERKRAEAPHRIMVQASNNASSAGYKAEGLKKEYLKVYNELQTLEETTREALNGLENGKTEDHGTETPDSGKTVLCAKCAAQLTLDKEKRVYQCNSCGVAYGISLFFGLPLEKALNSMNMGRYSDADQRFTNILMVEPSDFDALLGKILCTGKWSKVSRIGLTGDLRPISFKILKEQVEKTGESASDSDKAYFVTLGELISVLEELSMIDYKEKIAEKKNRELDIRDKVFSTPDNNIKSANYKERWSIEEKNRPYVGKKKDRQLQFERLKESLLQMKSGSVLNK